MKKNFKTFMVATLICIATALNMVVSLGCFFNLLGNARMITIHHNLLSVEDAAVYFVISGYGLLMTILYFRRKC